MLTQQLWLPTMPKKILVEQLSVGMFLHGLDGSWLDHPFWRTRFLIRSDIELHKLRSCGVVDCWIDPSKGEDLPVPLPGHAPTRETEAPEAPVANAQAQALSTEFACSGSADGLVAQALNDGDSECEIELQLQSEVDETLAKSGAYPDRGQTASGRSHPLPAASFSVAAAITPLIIGMAAPSAPVAATESPSAATPAPIRRPMLTGPTPAEKAFSSELALAAALLEQGAKVVHGLQADVSRGQMPEAATAAALLEGMLASLAREPSALISLARLKVHDQYEQRHPVAVAALMLALASELGLDEAQALAAGQAGLVHDIGHARLPKHLFATPGRLNTEQTAAVRMHVQHVPELLSAELGWHLDVAQACAQHHERFDGSGYPQGLGGESISRMARMLAICDVYDALSSNRPYQHALDPAEAIARLAASKGQFDGAMVSTLVRRLGLYPVGSLVSLESERLAVVMWQNPLAMSDPVLRVFYNQRERQRISPQLLDLSSSADAEDFIIGRASASEWPVGNVEALWSYGHAARVLGPGAAAGRAQLGTALRD